MSWSKSGTSGGTASKGERKEVKFLPKAKERAERRVHTEIRGKNMSKTSKGLVDLLLSDNAVAGEVGKMSNTYNKRKYQKTAGDNASSECYENNSVNAESNNNVDSKRTKSENDMGSSSGSSFFSSCSIQ